MKKLLTFTLSIILCLSISYSQNLIPKVGGTFSVVSSDSDSQVYPNGGLLVGVGIEFSLTDLISLQPELLFQQKGYINKGTITGSFSSADYVHDYTLNYFEVPLLAKFTFGKFYFNAGPSFSYGVSGKMQRQITDQGGTEKTSRDIKFGEKPEGYTGTDLYFKNAFDVGLQVGCGLKIVKFLSIDLRYGLGLLDMRDSESKNRCLQISAGFPIRLGNK